LINIAKKPKGQVERLREIFELLGKKVQGKTCEAIEGVISEGNEVLDEYKGEPVLDAGCRTVRTGETSFIVSIVDDEDVSNDRSRTRRTAQAQAAATC
jgi:hypothetical protein